MKRKILVVVLLLLLFCEIVLLGWLISLDGQAATAPMYGNSTYIGEPNDKPLLTTYEQIESARTRDFCSFYCGGTHYLAIGLPTEYIDYSEKYLNGTL